MFSVIIPTYNRRDLMQRSINSVLAQTFTDWELVIVDDGSTDDTEDVIKQYQAKDSRIKYIKKANSGGADSRNTGVRNATHEFIVFLDSDDDALPNWLQVASENIKPDTGCLCAGSYRHYTYENKTIDELPMKTKIMGEKNRVNFLAGSLFVRREVFNTIGGYDTNIRCGMHSDLGIQLLCYLNSADTKYKIRSIDAQLMNVYVHDEGRTRTDYAGYSHDALFFTTKYYNVLKKWAPEELANNYAVVAFNNYKLKKRKISIKYILKAIRHNPGRLRNYLRFIKYCFA